MDLALLSPTSFLEHSTLERKLKRQSSQLLSSAQLKKIALNPPTIADDRMMQACHDSITPEATPRMTVFGKKYNRKYGEFYQCLLTFGQEEIRASQEELRAGQTEMDISRISTIGVNLLAKFLDMMEKTGRRTSDATSGSSSWYIRAAAAHDKEKLRYPISASTF